MGQSGSTEERQAIRNLTLLKVPFAEMDDNEENKAHIVECLLRFCKIAQIEDSVRDKDRAILEIKDRRVYDVLYGLFKYVVEGHSVTCGLDQEFTKMVLIAYRKAILYKELYRCCHKSSIQPFLTCLLWKPEICLITLDVLRSMISPSTLTDLTGKHITATRRQFAEEGGFEALQLLLAQYAVIRDVSSVEEEIVQNVLLLFHITLSSRPENPDFVFRACAVGTLLNIKRPLLALCHHTILKIRSLAADLVYDMLFLIGRDQVHEVQEAAREYGALLYALYGAIEYPIYYSAKSSFSVPDMAAAEAEMEDCMVKKNTKLVEVFCAGNTRSKKAICRIVPVELFIPANKRSDFIARQTATPIKNIEGESSPQSQSHVHARSISTSTAIPSSCDTSEDQADDYFVRWLQEARTHGEDWRKIIQALKETHRSPELIWHEAMYSELKCGLEKEIDAFESKKIAISEDNADSVVRWNHEVFHIEYKSLQQELFVHEYFIEHLIPSIADLSHSYEVLNPLTLAWHLLDRITVEVNDDWKVSCIRCLRLLLRRHAMTFHGQLPLQFILQLLRDHQSQPLILIQECFSLINTAIMTTRNAPSESINRQCAVIATVVADALSDRVMIDQLSRASGRTYEHLDKQEMCIWDGCLHEFAADWEEEHEILIHNVCDKLIRSGVNVLVGIIRRAVHSLPILQSKIPLLCRLLAVDTLDHLTVKRILFILKQVSILDVQSCNDSLQREGLQTDVGTKWKAMALIYVLIASSDPQGSGMCLMAAEFLKENYNELQWLEGSSLMGPGHGDAISMLFHNAVGYNGCGMGDLLKYSTTDAFMTTFNAEEVKTADVMWNIWQRSRLHKYLKDKFSIHHDDKIDTLDKALLIAGNVSIENASEIYIGNIYLRCYLDDGPFLTKWCLEKFQSSISMLFKQLAELYRKRSIFGISGLNSSGSIQPWEEQVLIIRTLVKLMQTTCGNISIKKENLELVLLPLKRSLLGESDQILSVLAIQFFLTLLQPVSGSDDACFVNDKVCRNFLIEKGLNVIHGALMRMSHAAFQQFLNVQTMCKTSANTCYSPDKLLRSILDLLFVLLAHTSGPKALQQHTSIMSVLLKFANRAFISRSNRSISAHMLRGLSRLCNHPIIRSHLVLSGGLIVLIDTSAFYSAKNDVANCTELESTQTHGTETSTLEVVEEAVSVLQSCLLHEQETSQLVAVLDQLLTPNLVHELRNNYKAFIRKLRSEECIITPTLIWTQSMRKHLKECFSLQLENIWAAISSGIWPHWNPEYFLAAESFRYLYPELRDELLVDGIYLKKILVSDLSGLTEDQVRHFMEALLSSIQSNESCQNLLKERGTSDPKKLNSLVIMRQVLQKITSAYPNLIARASDTLYENESTSFYDHFDRNSFSDYEDMVV